MTDDVAKHDDEAADKLTEEHMGEEGPESAEPDFAPTATATATFDDEHHEDDGDPHSSFDEPTAHAAEDPHSDIFGLGVPFGFGGDDEGEDEEEESVEGVDIDAF